MKKNNKGFTLAELLIVVAIIAVLVAVAIPVFTTQLRRAEMGTDLANVRGAYAEKVTSQMAANAYNTSGKLTVSISPAHPKTSVSVKSGKVIVKHKADPNIKGSFTYDSDVTLTIH